MTHDEPVRSPEIVNVSELRVAPLVLGGVLLASLALGPVARRHALGAGPPPGAGRAAGPRVRRPRRAGQRPLAGHDPGRPSASSSGIPLGIVGGRAAWRFFADQLGVIPRTSVPLSWLALEVLLTAVLGWLAVAIPARAAARVSPTEELAAR